MMIVLFVVLARNKLRIPLVEGTYSVAGLPFVLCAAAIFFYEQAYHKFDNKVLFITALITIASFVVWWQFEHVLPPPDNVLRAPHVVWDCGAHGRAHRLVCSCEVIQILFFRKNKK